MSEAVILTCLAILAGVALVSLYVCASAVKSGAERCADHEKVMASLLTKTVNAIVVSEMDQVGKIVAENGGDPPEKPSREVPALFGAPDSAYQTVGDPRNDQID